MAVISPAAVDVHAHFLSRSYREALERAGIRHPDGFPFVPKWSVDSALALMDEVGIGIALLSVSSPGLSFVSGEERTGLAWAVNEDGAEAVRSHPHRLGLMASLPLPDVDAALQEIEHAGDVLHADGSSSSPTAQSPTSPTSTSPTTPSRQRHNQRRERRASRPASTWGGRHSRPPPFSPRGLSSTSGSSYALRLDASGALSNPIAGGNRRCG